MNRTAVSLAISLMFAAAATAVRAQSPPESPPSATPDDVARFQELLDRYSAALTAREDEPEPVTREQRTIRNEAKIAEFNRMIAEIDAFTQQAGATADALMLRALCLARKASILLEERRVLDRIVTDVELHKVDPNLGQPEPADFADVLERRVRRAAEVEDAYRQVNDAIDRALSLLDRADGGAAEGDQLLVQGVVKAQAALSEGQTVESRFDLQDFRRERNPYVEIDHERILGFLREAEGLLRQYVTGKTGMAYVRGRFYEAVVNYRISLKRRPEREADPPTRFEDGEGLSGAEREKRLAEAAGARAEAEKIFGELSDPARVKGILFPPGDADAVAYWERSSLFVRAKHTEDDTARFYAAGANLYLGLMIAVGAPDVSGDQAAEYDRAIGYLRLATEYDRRGGAAGATQPTSVPALPNGDSLTGGSITKTAELVRTRLESAKAGAGEAAPLNDLRITWGIAGLYDTNVTLLGRNTEPPLDEQRKRDYRVATLFNIDYTLDLNSLDPKSEALRKWQVYFQARVAPTWNGEIHDFNEQFYGGTTNVRYQLWEGDPPSDPSWTRDALYMDFRYDYDYFLLGNDGFLRQNRVRPSFRYLAMDQAIDASLFFAYEDRNYLELLRDERFDRDGNYFSWGGDVVLNMSKLCPSTLDPALWWGDKNWGGYAPLEGDQDLDRELALRLGVQFTSNSTVGDEFDYTSQILGAGVTVPLPYGLDFSYDAFFEWQDYWQPSLVDRNRRTRDDFIQEHGFRLQRRFYFGNYDPATFETEPLDFKRLVMTVYGDIRFIIDDSNVRDRLGQSIYEYNRQVYGIGLRFDLN